MRLAKKLPDKPFIEIIFNQGQARFAAEETAFPNQDQSTDIILYT